MASVQQTVDASNFPTLVGQFIQQPSCTVLLWQIDIFNLVKFSWFCLFFADIQVLTISQGKVAAVNRRGRKIKTPVDGLYY